MLAEFQNFRWGARGGVKGIVGAGGLVFWFLRYHCFDLNRRQLERALALEAQERSLVCQIESCSHSVKFLSPLALCQINQLILNALIRESHFNRALI